MSPNPSITLRLGELSDVELIGEVGSVLRRPRADPADSFVLHAPLELAARAALLPHVVPAGRDAARARLVDLAEGYEAFGPSVPEPSDGPAGRPDAAAAALVSAIGAGDLDAVDAAAYALGRSARPRELQRLLAADVAPRLAAAAHGPIFLFQLPRVSPRGEVSAELVRSLARELGREAGWRLHWIDSLPSTGAAVGRAVTSEPLFAAIAAAPQLGSPGSDFIYPVMAQVDRGGVAADLLADPVTQLGAAGFEAGARGVLRAAAWSMLLEPDDYAPYGWSHALTMPQAVLGIAGAIGDPARALAIAATYVVGLRAAFATRPLVAGLSAPDPGIPPRVALEHEPDLAAASVWHAGPDGLRGVAAHLATGASAHHDAHLVKYTLACLDAAAWDRDQARLYLAAAAHLHAFWARVGSRV